MEAVVKKSACACNAFMNDDKEAAERGTVGMLITKMCDEVETAPCSTS